MKTCIIALEYLEQDYQETVKCLDKLKYPVFKADRQGWGNMAQAFNIAYKKNNCHEFDLVWFVTNITFKPSDLEKLIKGIGDYAAICPTYDSDHLHLIPSGRKGVEEIPFVEFTCPLVKTEAFNKIKLDNQLPYYSMIVTGKQM